MRPLTLAMCAAALLAPVAANAATAAPGAAAPNSVLQDARCLMIMGALTSSKEQSVAMEAQFGVAYFAGRIKARDPSFNLGTRLQGVASGMNGQPMQAEANRCAPAVAQALSELQAAQKSFSPPPSPSAPSGGAPAPKPTPAPGH